MIVSLPTDLNEKLLDVVAQVRRDTGKRTSKEKVIINLLKQKLNYGN